MTLPKILDFHTHFATPRYPQTPDEAKARDLGKELHGIDEMLASMDRWEIDVSVVSATKPMDWYSWEGMGWGPHVSRYGGNEEVAEAAARFPDRIIGCFVPNVFKSAREVRADIEEFVERRGFRAIKLHPWVSGFPGNADELRPVFEAAAAYRLPVLYHSGTIAYTTPAQMFDMARQFPKVSIVMGHSGKGDLCYDALAVARYADNLFFETSGQPNRVFLERVIEELGSERVLYGSDWIGSLGKLPFRRVEVEVLNVSAQDKEDIFHRNAERLLGMDD